MHVATHDAAPRCARLTASIDCAPASRLEPHSPHQRARGKNAGQLPLTFRAARMISTIIALTTAPNP